MTWTASEESELREYTLVVSLLGVKFVEPACEEPGRYDLSASEARMVSYRLLRGMGKHDGFHFWFPHQEDLRKVERMAQIAGDLRAVLAGRDGGPQVGGHYLFSLAEVAVIRECLLRAFPALRPPEDARLFDTLLDKARNRHG